MIKLSMMNLNEDCISFRTTDIHNVFLYPNRIDVYNIITKNSHSIKLTKKVSEIDRSNSIDKKWIICSNTSFQYLLNIETSEMLKINHYISVFGNDIPLYGKSKYINYDETNDRHTVIYDIIRLCDKIVLKSYEIKHKYSTKLFYGFEGKIIFEEDGILNILDYNTDQILSQKPITKEESESLYYSITYSDKFSVHRSNTYSHYCMDYSVNSLNSNLNLIIEKESNLRRFYHRNDENGNSYLIAIFVKKGEQYIYCYDEQLQLKAKLKPTVKMSSISSSQIRIYNNSLIVNSLIARSNGKSYIQFQKNF